MAGSGASTLTTTAHGRALPLRGPASSLLLLIAWLCVNRHTLAWIARSFATGEQRTNLVLLLAAVALAATACVRVGGQRLTRSLLEGPRAPALPLLVLAACTAGLYGRDLLFQLNILSAVLFGMGSWALAGLFLPAPTFRRVLPLVLLLLALLPFGTHLDVFLGFPARIATARLVSSGLARIGVSSIPAESILVLENGIADIDLPCSGVKSLWAGAILLLAATFLDGRRMRGRWLLVAAAHGLLLLAANAGRVFLLVLLHFVARHDALARIAHLPLGVLGFVAASAVTLALLAKVPRHHIEPEQRTARRIPMGALVLAATLAIAHPPAHTAVATGSVPATSGLSLPALPALPAEMIISPLSLTPAEQKLYFLPGGAHAEKWRFSSPDHSGSLLVVTGGSFRIQHAPEVCLAAAGLSVNEVRESDTGESFPHRVLVLDGGRRSAAWWFQSPTRTTPRLLERAIAEVTGRQRSWALVSILFDTRIAPGDPVARRLLDHIHDAVATRLQGEER